MLCTYCGARNVKGVMLCARCGAPLRLLAEPLGLQSSPIINLGVDDIEREETKCYYHEHRNHHPHTD